MLTPSCLNVLGLVLALAGILVLFRYGMPYRIRADEGEYIATNSVRESERRKDARYSLLGWLGLILILTGTASQIAANIIS